MENNTYEKLIKFRNGDNNSLDELLILFNPLINKYSRLLDGEDTSQDLTLQLIKTMNNIPIDKDNFFKDQAILGYVVKSIRNEYIRLSKKADKKRINEVELNLDIEVGYEEFESEMEMLDLFNVLTDKEAYIMKLIYVYYLSVTEVADYMKISRQSVNQTKNKALNKVRELF